jgi:hypothetical protein
VRRYQGLFSPLDRSPEAADGIGLSVETHDDNDDKPPQGGRSLVAVITMGGRGSVITIAAIAAIAASTAFAVLAILAGRDIGIDVAA